MLFRSKVGSQCEVHGSLDCLTCNPNFYLEEYVSQTGASKMRCEPNRCYCENGVEEDEGYCTENNGHECKTCTSGFHLNDDKKCAENICSCENGTPVDTLDCDEDGKHKCKSCNPFDSISNSAGYHLNNETMLCEMNQCTCSNGVAVEDADCTQHEANQCQSCDTGVFNTTPGYHLSDGIGSSCLINQCVCDMGIPSVTCQVNGGFECQSCTNPGYTFNSATTQCDTNICS